MHRLAPAFLSDAFRLINCSHLVLFCKFSLLNLGSAKRQYLLPFEFCGDLRELVERGLQVLGDFGGDYVGLEKVRRVL